MASSPDWQDRIARRIRLRDLHVFAAVIRAGSMNRAAADLGVTQPAVSQAVADLEAAIGQTLLDRGQSGVAPTAYGEVLLRRSTESFDALHQAIRDIGFLADPGCVFRRNQPPIPIEASRLFRSKPAGHSDDASRGGGGVRGRVH
jgi:DNA-binding transcriptional LysR family regulator